ncbi:hypothetical protein [Caulobacter sp. Root1472]|uniref:hypothetical protein n=1 Tax=Caulobacter sp. Root1472 TaxID=1736470 RepID=UPI0006FB8195|nr:hypothetical protein [Caulobacter sp. Root1472]KQZ22078.1 hypothetical protein ASD47_08125 [Caulobacter sp. Root1472]
MIERTYQQGDQVLRTGVNLPHLGVYSGQVYEVEDFERHHAEGLYVRGVPEGLDPDSFQPIEA